MTLEDGLAGEWVDDDMGVIVFGVSCSDRGSEPSEIGYRLKLMEGELPPGLLLPEDARRATMLGESGQSRDGLFYLTWTEESPRKPFDFTFFVVAIDKAGNESGESAPVRVVGFVPDLDGAKGENALFLIGMLDDYLGRTCGDDSEVVESFYCNEHVQAFVFRMVLEKVCREQGIDFAVEEGVRQDCLISWSSPDLTRYVNAFYRFTIFGRSVVADSGRKIERYAHLSYEQFEHADRELKLAYLAGVYFRYQEGEGFRFANSVEKVKLVAQLLEDVGCSGVSTNSRAGLPARNTVAFEATPEIQSWFQRLPGNDMIDSLDSYLHVPDADELKIYATVLKAAREGAFEGCELQQPYELYRLTFIAMDGDAHLPGVSGSAAEALEDYNRVRRELASLRSLGEEIPLCIQCGGDPNGCSASFLRIGFDASRRTAMTFLSYGCYHDHCCYRNVAVFLEKKDAVWGVTGYSIRGQPSR